MSWDSIIGQRRAKTILQSAIASGTLPSAWLFSGPEGIGKDAAAIEVAKALRCENLGPQGTPCNQCRGCLSAGALTNTNVKFVFALPSGKGEDSRSDSPMLKLSDGEMTQIREQVQLKAEDPYHNITIPRAQQIKISSIREVKRDISFSASEPGWRVVIVSEAHVMGDEAANAFLKTLEEPTPQTLLILTSSQPERLLPTIRSRCQEVRFDPLTDEQIVSALIQRRGVTEAEAALPAKLSGGSYSRAVELMTGDLNQLRFDVVTFLRNALKRSPISVHTEIERLTKDADRTRLEQILVLLELWLRDAWSIRTTGTPAYIVNEDQADDLQRFCNNFATARIDVMIRYVEDCIRAIRANAQIPLSFIVLALRLEQECFAQPQ